MKTKVLTVRVVDDSSITIFETRMNEFLKTVKERVVSVTVSNPSGNFLWFIASIVYLEEDEHIISPLNAVSSNPKPKKTKRKKDTKKKKREPKISLPQTKVGIPQTKAGIIPLPMVFGNVPDELKDR